MDPLLSFLRLGEVCGNRLSCQFAAAAATFLEVAEALELPCEAVGLVLPGHIFNRHPRERPTRSLDIDDSDLNG
ncbi:MAG: hypothetical protein IPK39_24305 [Sulfuritalea sp.]|nr:hypothetical protein [Sulfuritalea sp.]